MYLICCLAFIKAKFQFDLFTSHIQRITNDLADRVVNEQCGLFLYSPLAGQSKSYTNSTGAAELDTNIIQTRLDRSVEHNFGSGLATNPIPQQSVGSYTSVFKPIWILSQCLKACYVGMWDTQHRKV